MERPVGVTVLPCLWRFKLKMAEDGSVARYKARLCAGGHRHIPGVHFDESYAPVPAFTATRVTLAIAAARGLSVEQADFVNAYLNAVLPDSPAIYMRQPEGFVDPTHPDRVLRLRKALYGLAQAGLIWHDTLDAVVTSEASGHVASSADPSVYVKLERSPAGEIISRHLVCNYVDDMITAATDPAATAAFKSLLRKDFELKELGAPAFLLGVNIARDDKGGLTLSMQSYINSLLESFDTTACRSAYTPMEVRLLLDKLEQGDAGPDHHDAVARLAHNCPRLPAASGGGAASPARTRSGPTT